MHFVIMAVRMMSPTWCLFLLLGCIFNVKADATNPLIFSTNECSLTEPVHGHVFNFSALKTDFAHWASGDYGDTFEFNICGNLKRSCHGRNDAAACLKKSDNSEYVLGTKQQLEYNNGKMYFTFSNGEKCPNSSQNYALHVFMGCDYTLDRNQSRVISYAADACSFYITFETPFACLPEPENVKGNNCSVYDPKSNHVYDLMPLSDSNYRTFDRNGNSFVINICKPVLYGENAMCPSDSSVCFVKHEANYKEKFINYGSAQRNPTIENGNLIIRHTSSTPCKGSTNYTSVITFTCQKDFKNDHPEFTGAFDDCLYTFSFPTQYACNELPACTAVTHDKEIIDMSSLKDTQFKLQRDNQNYIFAICSAAGQPCMENDGSCAESNNQATSLGKISTHLSIDQTGTPYLLYKDGAICETKAGSLPTKWSTRIEFVCANRTNGNGNSNNDSNFGPKIIENSKCSVLIQYQTELACREQINCKTKVYVEHSEDGTGMDYIDLTPLISNTENYVAEIDASLMGKQQLTMSTKFFLNVCRPLVPKFALGCPGGSAACMAIIDKDTGKPEEEKSLGLPLASLVAINRTSAELRYLLGDSCPSDKTSQMSSKIEFICEMRAGKGVPKLRAITDCHYQFTWATNVICPPHMCNFNEDTCEIMNDELNVRYNLKNASFATGGKRKVTSDKGEFTLDLCDSHHKAVTDYSQGLVNLFFTTKGSCGSYGIINVQMRLICSSITESSTSFSECNLLYIQKTPDICDFLGLSEQGVTTTTTTTTVSPTSKPHTPKPTSWYPTESTENHPAERTGSIGSILAAILSVTFVVACLGMFAFSPERRNMVRRLFNRTSSSVRYSRVNNSEEGNLLLNPNGEFTESDDDDMLL
ncbi:lysosomal enzyme receptor protein [Haematobia irritans]|uniref:lysosomal enzyme receptor protein n=1 Tax=Haematobia irritans TaxID=7368 RepID=UPI003F4FE1B7